MKNLTIKEAFEKQGLKVIDECKVGPYWWQIEHEGYTYTIKLVNGYADWATRFHVDKYAKIGDKYCHEGKLCTRANFNKVVSLIKNS